MSLYLHESITPEVIREAKKAGITGVKSYPAGVTTVRLLPHDPNLSSILMETTELLFRCPRLQILLPRLRRNGEAKYDPQSPRRSPQHFI